MKYLLSILCLFIFSCDTSDSSPNATEIEGCTDSIACNYDDIATQDDNSCTYAEENFDCYGNCVVDVDCNGDCGGLIEFDECGECGGQGTGDENGCCSAFNFDGNSLTCEDNEVALWCICFDVETTEVLDCVSFGINNKEISPNIGELVNLKNIYCSNSNLVGEIPPQICSLTNLTEVEFENNKLCPPYPDCISQNIIDSQDISNCPSVFIESSPNPFNESTTITFYVNESQNIEIKIYNLLGEVVAILLNEFLDAGIHESVFDGTHSDGYQLSSGIYLARLSTSQGDVDTIKLMILY